MFKVFDRNGPRSLIMLYCLIGVICCTVVVSILDGILVGFMSRADNTYLMLRQWLTDFRYLFGDCIYATAILYLGAKFLETRTIVSIGFEKIGAAAMSVKGPDPDNMVWVGRKYGTLLEAEAVATTIARRIEEISAAT